MKQFILLIAFVVSVVVCEKLPESGPYAPSGWKPQGAVLTLPLEYGAPSNAFRQQPSAQEININRERFQFAGQFAKIETVTASNKYLPPAAPTKNVQEVDNLGVQGLPSNSINTGEILPQQSTNQRFTKQQIRQPRPLFQRQQQFQPQQFPQQQFQPQQFQPQQFQQQQFQPQQFQPQIQQFQPQQQQQQQFQPQLQFQQQTQFQPQPSLFVAQQYGPPQPQSQLPPQQYGPPQVTETETEAEYPEQQTDNPNAETNEDDAEQVEQDGGPSISIANAATNGQYYILNEDNTLQKVIYMTGQTQDDLRKNGFSAQLKYEPVEPIRDPIYAFDTQGQLIRILNKK